MTYNDDENLKLLYSTAGGLPYDPPTYTSARDFTPAFPNVYNKPFVSDIPRSAKPEWQPEPPWPQIHTKDYKKTLLTVL